MKRKGIVFILAVILIVTIWGPEVITVYSDRKILNKIQVEETEDETRGYRYRLNSGEKLFLLSRCLDRQSVLEEKEHMENQEGVSTVYGEMEGTYAFIINHKGPTGREISREEIFETANRQIEKLMQLGLIPKGIKTLKEESYTAQFYSAIDVLEPRNNVAVWKISLSNSQSNADKKNRVIDLILDGDTGKIYEFYVRTPLVWEEIDPKKMVDNWAEDLGLGEATEYESENPLLETTPYFKKYSILGMGEEKTVVTIGFYEGINELFLKITR